MKRLLISLLLILNIHVSFAKNADGNKSIVVHKKSNSLIDIPSNFKIFDKQDCDKTGIKPLELQNDEVLMPQYDGVNYFIDVDGMRPAADIKPSQLKIEAAIKNPGSTYRIENVSDLIEGKFGGDFKRLPMVITVAGKDEGKNVTIVVLSIIFSQTETRAQAGILSALPDKKQFQDEQGNQQNIYFGAELTLKKGGAMGGAFALIAPKTLKLFPLQGIANISLSVGTGICLGCEARSKSADDLLLFLSGTIELHPNIAVAEDANGDPIQGDLKVPKLLFSVQIPSWKGATIKATLPSENYGIQLTKLPFVGFQAKKVDGKQVVAITETDISNNFLCKTSTDVIGYNVIYDFSDEGVKVDNKKVNGLIFQNLSVRLPKQIKDKSGSVVRLDVDYFYVDDNGVNTVVSRTQAQGQGYLVQPQIEGIFDLGVRDIAIKVDKNALVLYKLSGDLELPILKDYALYFSVEKGDQKIIDSKTGESKINDILTFKAGLKQENKPVHLNIFSVDATITGESRDEKGKLIASVSPIVSTGTVNLTNGNFESFGVTMNYGTFSILKVGGPLSFKFDKLAIITKSPYLEEFTLTPNDNAKGLTVAGFSLGISSLSIKGDPATGIIKGAAQVDLKVSGEGTNQNIKMSAGLVFEATTKTEDGKKKFKFVDFGVDKVFVRANFPTFGFEGALDLFNDAPRLGVAKLTGFEGKAKFWFNFMTEDPSAKTTSPKTGEAAQNSPVQEKGGGGVYMVFAKDGKGQDAWAVDVDVNFGKTGIIVGTVSLKGIFGGAYSNLKIKGDPIVKATGDKGSRTGLAYAWDPGRWGFNLGLDLSTAEGNVDISAMLAVEGKAKEGLSFIKAAGYAKFNVSVNDLLPGVSDKIGSAFDAVSNVVNKIPKDILPSVDNLKKLATTEELAKGKAKDGSESLAALFNKKPDGTGPSRIAAGLIIALNFENGGINSLSVKMYPDIFIDFSNPISSVSLESTGYGMLYLSREKKYLHLGNSQSINDRLGLKFKATTENDVLKFDLSAFVNAYFMLGDGVSPDLPPPLIPKSFSEFTAKEKDLNRTKTFIGNENGDLATGSGIAFGAAVGVGLSLNIAYVFGVNAEVGAGFDALLVNKSGCSASGWGGSSDGATGWKAQAQIYGYAKAKITVLFVPLVDFGIAFLLKASIPKPLYAKGYFTAYLRIWKAEAKFTLKGEIGEGCLETDPPVVYTKEKFKLIDDFTPNATKKISPVGNMYMKCKYPKDQVLALEKGLDKEKGYFKQHVEVKIIGGNADGTDMIISKTGIDPKSHVEDLIKLSLTEKLEKNKSYKIIVKSKIYTTSVTDEKDEQGNTVNTYEENQTVKYLTKDKDGNPVEVTLEDEETYQITTTEKEFDLIDEDVLAYPAKNQYNVYRSDYDGQGYLKIDTDVATKIQAACPSCNVRLGVFKDNVLQGTTTSLNLLTDTDYQLNTLEKDKIYELRILATVDGSTQVLYQKHDFRISNLETFAYKITSLSSVIKPNWVSYDLEFNLITNNPTPNEPFSEDEVKKSLGLKVNIGDGTWLKTTLDDFNAKMVGKELTFDIVEDWAKFAVCKQSQYTFLKDGQKSSVMSDDKNNYASPAFVYAPFQGTILSMLKILTETKSDPNSPFYNYYIPTLGQGTSLCLEIKNDISKFEYFKSHRNYPLPSRFAEQTNNICFEVPEDINFNDLTKIQKTVVVNCNIGAFDGQAIVYSFELKSSEGISLKFPNDFTINCENKLGLGKNDNFTNVQDFVIENGKPQPVLYASKRKSIDGCPTVSQFSGSNIGLSSVTNKFEIKVNIEDAIKPCLTISDITTESAIAECLKSLGCDAIEAGTTERKACEDACSGMSVVTTEKKFRIESWENNSRKDFQVVRSTMPLKLSNGQIIQFPEKKNNLEITINNEDLTVLNGKALTILVEDASLYTCGENLGDVKVLLPGMASTGNGNSIAEACQSTEESVVYCSERIDKLVAGNSIVYGEIEPNQAIIDKNFYAFGQGATREVFVFEKGIYKQKYFCGSNPQMKVTCVINQRTPRTTEICVQERDIVVSFFSTLPDGGTRPEFPWYIPESGLLVGGILIPKNEITSSTITKTGIKDGRCDSDAAINARKSCDSGNMQPIPGVIITTPPKGDCAVKPAKPTISSTSLNNLANYGEQVSITATGCSGNVQWNGIKETTATIKQVVTNASTFFANCLDASTNCLSEQASITIKLKDVSISAVKDYICEGQTLTLTADGCGATPEWSSDDTGLDLSAANGLIINVKPTKATKFTLKCKVDNANAQIADKSFSFYGIIAKPVIEDDIALNQNKTICAGETVKISTTTACEAGKILEWSNAALTTFINVKPLVNTTYFAVCKDLKCSSVESNKIDIVSISLKKAVVSSNTFNKTTCVGNNFILTATNCEVNDVVYWYKKGVAASFSQGNTVTISATVSTTYLAKCRRSITSDNSKWCEGDVSDEMPIRVVTPTDLSVSLAIGTNSMCAYQSTTLTASGCDLGILEWQLPNESTWKVLANDAKQYSTNTQGLYKVRCNLNNSCYNVGHTSGTDVSQYLTINPEPQAPILTTDKVNNTICAGESIGLSGVCSLGSLVWQDLPSNPIKLDNAKTYTYNAVCKSDKNCRTQTLTPINVTVNPIPQKLTISSSVGSQMCEYDANTITASGCNEKVIWKDNTTVNPIVDYKNNQGEYYFAAKCEEKGCTGVFSNDFKLTVYNRPAKPGISVSKASVCYGQETISLSVTGCDAAGSSVKWNDNDVLRTKTLRDIGNYEYSVKCILNNCESNASEVAKAVVLATPSVPQISSSKGWSICDYDPTTISTGCSVASNPVWSNSTLLNVSKSGDYTAYCQGDNGCRSNDSDLKKLTVYGRPAKPTVSITNDNICQGSGSMSMSVNGCTNASIKWNDGDVTSTKSFTNTGIYKYRVQCIQNNCESEWSEYAEGNVLFTPNKPSITGDASICDGANTNITATCENSTLVWTTEPAKVGSVGIFTYTATCESTGCRSASNSFTQTVYSYPEEPVIVEDRQCGKTVLTVNNCSGSISWSNGGNVKSIEITTKGSYTAYCNSNGCTTQKTINTSDIKVNPAAPSIATSDGETGTINVCNDGSKMLNADGLVHWYKDGKEVQTKSNIEGATEGSYKALKYTDGCNSDFSNEIIIKSLKVSEPSAITEDKYCDYTLLKGSCTAGNPDWSDGSLNKNEIRITTTGKFVFICNNSNFCFSEKSEFTVTSINKTPITPTIELGYNMSATPCNNTSTALYNKLIIATDYAEWQKNDAFYVLDGGNNSPLGIYNIENGTYKVRAKRGDCYSGFSNAITISRITVTTPTIGSVVSNCQNLLSLSNTCEGTVKWYDSANTLLATASTYSTPLAKTIYAKCEKSGCVSGNSNSVIVSAINKTPDWSDAGEACTDGQKWKDRNACSDSYNSERCLKQYLITLTNLFPERNLPNSSCSYDYTDAYGVLQSGTIRTLLDKKTITVYSISEPVSKSCSNGSLSIDLVVPDKN
jgi:hypothetical protein